MTRSEAGQSLVDAGVCAQLGASSGFSKLRSAGREQLPLNDSRKLLVVEVGHACVIVGCLSVAPCRSSNECSVSGAVYDAPPF